MVSACAEVHIQSTSHRLGSNWDYRDLSGFIFMVCLLVCFRQGLPFCSLLPLWKLPL